MSIVSFRPEDLLETLPAPVPVKVPLGEPVAATRTTSFNGAAASARGVWECSPGTWRRQVLQAEFCTFLEGEAVFEPDEGEPLHIRAGDAVYFPANTGGIWRIQTTLRKTFVVFDEQP
ncbi:cupin domain-containing protein [Phenylobacterium sp. J367]|uniref:cupin domain-containing protein n=1 Tax=Phenylobacterium sp. J367 TaxID=2898435 RepID=UPI002150D7AE|nr:cupin domain-containing protein [Phenylobacterium sp. J367]MCR5880669.1 cupin domain-containing protein [Phenylobacterium sp. J367]